MASLKKINGRDKAIKNTYFYNDKAYDVWLSSNYINVKFLDRGGFGMVCEATQRLPLPSIQVAIKVINLKNNPRILSVLREIKISKYMTMNKSKAIVKLLDIEIPATVNKENNTWKFDQVCLIYEIMQSDLNKFIKSKEPKNEEPENEEDTCQKMKDEEEYRRRLLAQMLFGVRDMHHANLLHRDLKPSNMLLDSKGDLKICDFGLSRAMKTSHSNRVLWKMPTKSSSDDDDNAERKMLSKEFLDGRSFSYTDTTAMKNERMINGLTNDLGTPGYRAPELTLGCVAYQKPTDIWSIGCVFAELVKKERFFQVPRGRTNEEQFNAIISKFGSSFISGDLKFIDNKDGLKLADKKIAESIIGTKLADEFKDILDPHGIKLLQKLLRFDPDERIKAQNALRSSYLKDTYKQLREEFIHLEKLDEQIEMENEQSESEETLKGKVWYEMQDFHAYNKKEKENALKDKKRKERSERLKVNNDEQKQSRYH